MGPLQTDRRTDGQTGEKERKASEKSKQGPGLRLVLWCRTELGRGGTGLNTGAHHLIQLREELGMGRGWVVCVFV